MQNNDYKEEVAKILIDIESIKFSFKKPFTLTSGNKSPVYVDCRKIISFIKERNIILKIKLHTDSSPINPKQPRPINDEGT